MIPEIWHDFYVSVAGAAAALAGLVFVGLSLNLDKILEGPGLPARAGETLVLLGAALMAALIILIPGQSFRAFGLELVAVGAVAWGLPVVLQVIAYRVRQYQKPWQFAQRVVLYQAATVPMLIAGALLLGRAVNGVYWLALGVMLALVVGLLNAWVLLVEIVR